MSEYFITTTNGQKVYFSEEDALTVLENTWTKATDGYAKRYYEKSEEGKRTRWVKYMHREILQPQQDEIVDHINQDKLDNRRKNLRVADKSLNALNSSKSRGATSARGVFFNNHVKKYQSGITINGKRKHLGFFTDLAKASEAYLKAQKEYTNVI